MTTIKAYTDLEQSKKLTEILPFESADMFYIAGKGEPIFIGNKMVAYGDDDYDALGGPDVLCWSLAALLDVLPIVDLCAPALKMKLNHKYYMELCIDSANYKYISTNDYDNPVDACVTMIEKLHKLKML